MTQQPWHQQGQPQQYPPQQPQPQQPMQQPAPQQGYQQQPAPMQQPAPQQQWQQAPQQQYQQQPMGQPMNQPAQGYQQQQPPAQGGVPAWMQAVAGATLGNKGGRYFENEDGCYVCDIETIKVINNQDGGQTFVVEMIVVESTNPTVLPGEKRSFVTNINQYGVRDVLAFFHLMVEDDLKRAGQPYDPNTTQITPDIQAFYTSEQQPARGRRLKVDVYTKPQKKDKTKDFTHHDFEVLPPGTVLGLQTQAAAAPAPQSYQQPPAQQQMAPAQQMAPQGYQPPPQQMAPQGYQPPPQQQSPAQAPNGAPPGWDPNMPYPPQQG